MNYDSSSITSRDVDDTWLRSFWTANCNWTEWIITTTLMSLLTTAVRYTASTRQSTLVR